MNYCKDIYNYGKKIYSVISGIPKNKDLMEIFGSKFNKECLDRYTSRVYDISTGNIIVTFTDPRCHSYLRTLAYLKSLHNQNKSLIFNNGIFEAVELEKLIYYKKKGMYYDKELDDIHFVNNTFNDEIDISDFVLI